MQGLRVLIIDVRGNGGGQLHSAVQLAERFLPQGTAVLSTQGDSPDANREFRAEQATVLAIPLVILTDGQTASAAEVFAGSLQAHHRATLVGQATFGKWSMQRIIEMKSCKAGLSVTVARIVLPRAMSTPRGITPDVLEDRSPISMADNQLLVAIQVAHRLLEMAP
jgi:carboxyl-terminal processing protease